MTDVIYLGSFDPFHFGHKEIVDYLLSNKYNVIILLSPCTNSKQNKTNIYHRKNIIKCYFKKSQNVIIECADEYLGKVNVTEMTGIMGSDAYNDRILLQKLPKIHLQKWLIVTRNGETCLPNTLDDFNVEFLDHTLFAMQQTSSTVVRGLLKNNLMCESMLEEALDYCNIFGVYNDHDVITKFVDQKANYIFVSSNMTTIGIKLFFDEKDEFMSELDGYDHLSDKINIASPISIYNQNIMCYIVYEKINGSSLKHLLQSSTPEKIYQLGISIGKILQVFHNSNTINFELNDIETNPIIKKIGKHHFEEVQSKYKKCYLHGDMSINNVCYDETCNELYFIDPEKSIKYIDTFGNPSGISYYEYQQFLSSVELYSNSDNNSYLKNGFIEGYGNINKCDAIDKYWQDK